MMLIKYTIILFSNYLFIISRGQEFLTVAGFDYCETFSPVVKPATIQVILSIAVNNGWKIHQIDVNNAFLNEDLQEEVYMAQPFGFEDNTQPKAVFRLIKSIYGLKQAPRAWFEKLQGVLVGQRVQVCSV